MLPTGDSRWPIIRDSNDIKWGDRWDAPFPQRNGPLHAVPLFRRDGSVANGKALEHVTYRSSAFSLTSTNKQDRRLQP